MKIKRTAKALTGLCLLAITMSFSGCMTHPGDGQYVGKISNPVTFSGFLMNDPNEPVYVYARKGPGYSWNLIKSTATDTWPYLYQGQVWHYWSTQVVVPSWMWKYEGYGTFSCEVRSENTHADLLTFEEGFSNWWMNYDTIEEMYQDRGNGLVVKIFGK